MAGCVPLRWINTLACAIRRGRRKSLTGNRNGDNDEQVDVEESGTRMISRSESVGRDSPAYWKSPKLDAKE